MICPDCGLTLSTDKDQGVKTPVVCSDCLSRSQPEPDEGWPIRARWVSQTRGRGVQSSSAITKGDVVERCWVMPLSPEESQASLGMPILNRYLFPWVDGQRVLVSGSGLLYNYDSQDVTHRDPNVECILRRGISALEFRALRDIQPGEELTWDYKKAKLKLA